MRRAEAEESAGELSPEMRLEDVLEARTWLSTGNAAGSSGCTTEMIELLGPEAVHCIWMLFKDRYEGDVWEPVKDMKYLTMCFLAKVLGATGLRKCRGASLLEVLLKW